MHTVVKAFPFAAGIVALVFGVSPARAGNENAVAVLDIQGTGIATDLLPTLTEILSAEIAELKTYKVIAGRDIQSMIGFEKQKDVLGCTDAACLAEIGGALGVDRIVASHIGRVGSTYVVNIKLINIRMADTEARVYETVRGEDDALIATVRRSVQKLFGASGKSADVAQAAPPTAAPAPQSVQPRAVAAPQPAAKVAPKPAPSAPTPEPEQRPAADAPVAQETAQVESSDGGGRVLPWVLVGVGAASTVVGVVFGMKAKSAEECANDRTCVGGQLEAESAAGHATKANLFTGLGLASVGAGLVLWWVGAPSATTSTAHLAPLLGPESIGVAVSSRF